MAKLIEIRKKKIITNCLHKVININLVIKSRLLYLFFYFFFPKDFGEAYHIGVDVAKDDPNCGKFFYGPNIWPPAGNSR